MGNESIRIAIGLHLGVSLCVPHTCPRCGMDEVHSGVQGLSCRNSQGIIPCHSALNDIIHWALTAANVPATLEPRGLCRRDGKRPDGLSIIPWARGRALVWDVTCWDSFAPSNIHLSSSRVGLLADHAATRKRALYAELSTCYHFLVIAFASTGAFGHDALDFVYDLAKCCCRLSYDPLSYLKLSQRIRLSVCIQNFNAISILGCCTV